MALPMPEKRSSPDDTTTFLATRVDYWDATNPNLNALYCVYVGDGTEKPTEASELTPAYAADSERFPAAAKPPEPLRNTLRR